MIGSFIIPDIREPCCEHTIIKATKSRIIIMRIGRLSIGDKRPIQSMFISNR